MLTRAHDAFLALIAPGLAWRGERSPEVPAVARRADLVWEVERGDGVRRLLHIELQIKVEDDIGERLLEYFVRLRRRDRRPVRSVVVFLRKVAALPASPFVVPWDERDDSLTYRFEVVRLWEIPQERVLATPRHELWPLAGLMAGATVETTVATAERIAALPAPREECTDLIGLLAGLAGIQFPHATVLAALRRHPMIEELLRESSVAQELLDEGRAEGEARGKADGERQMAQLALEGMHGPLGEDALAALHAADEPTLRALVSNIETDTIEQVRQRLGLG